MSMQSGGRVIIKLVGGLITDKRTYKTADIAAIRGCAAAVEELISAGKSVVLVHGAGSFGHTLSQRWRLSEGRCAVTPDEGDSIMNQDEAISQVRQDMLELSRLLVTEFKSSGLAIALHPPNEWVTGTGPGFNGELDRFITDTETIQMTFGDVVQCDPPEEFGILSGDDLMVRLATEMFRFDSCIFALGGVDGLLSSPPGRADSKLLPEWSPTDSFTGLHESRIDVTGGIQLKVDRAAKIAGTVERVWLVDGMFPDRIVTAGLNGLPVGTRILA